MSELLKTGAPSFEKDEDSAYIFAGVAASMGNAPAQYSLSEFYMKGMGVEVNGEKAIQWLRKSASQNYPQACMTLARCLMHGHLTEANPQEASELYRKAASAGIASAYSEMGEIAFYALFENREISEEDKARCGEDLRIAAASGDAQSLMHLGVLLKEGIGMPQDLKEAFESFRKSAELGNGMSMYALSEFYEQGLGVEADEKLSLSWLNKAAEAGVLIAQFRLGRAHMTGARGVEEDLEQAAAWFRRAADGGHSESKCYLGSFCMAGLGVEQNVEMGLGWLKEAGSDEKDPSSLALFMLGMHYLEEGQMKQSIPWLTKASEHGNAKAQEILGTILLDGVEGVVEKDEKKAFALLYSASEESVNATFLVGKCLHYGLGVPVNTDLARKKYEEAASYGLEAATEELAKLEKLQ